MYTQRASTRTTDARPAGPDRRERGRAADVPAPDEEFPAPRSFAPPRPALRWSAFDERYRGTSRNLFSRTPRRPDVLALALFALAVLAVAVGITLMSLTSGAPAPDTPLASNSPSTPKSAWKEGEVPFLYQADAQWAERPYAGGTVAENGCGPTCLSMAYIALTGNTDRDPASISAFSELNGFTAGSDTTWSLMTEGAAKLGLTSQEVPADTDALAKELRAGHPVIASMGPGDFTSQGHFIVIAGMDSDGKLEVRGPNSQERSHAAWDAQRVLEQCRGIWALSRP